MLDRVASARAKRPSGPAILYVVRLGVKRPDISDFLNLHKDSIRLRNNARRLLSVWKRCHGHGRHGALVAGGFVAGAVGRRILGNKLIPAAANPALRLAGGFTTSWTGPKAALSAAYSGIFLFIAVARPP
jgi:hypothetical protein